MVRPVPLVLLISCVVAALGAFSCAGPDYVYRPTTLTNAQVAGRVASDYQIPPEEPTGDVKLATFGIMRIKPAGAPEGTFTRALHTRMVVANNSAVPWSVDTREQRATMNGLGESRPAFAAVPSGAAPVVIVPPGGRRVIDLFFPLPAANAEPKNIAAFDVIWRVHTGERVVAERTPFERMEVVSNYYDAPNNYWGGGYFYDPYYPSAAFYGTTLAPAYVDRPVFIEPVVPVR